MDHNVVVVIPKSSIDCHFTWNHSQRLTTKDYRPTTGRNQTNETSVI